MDQRISILGLLFSILVSAESSTTISNNAFYSKPEIMDGNHSAIKMRTIFLNKKFSDSDSNDHDLNRTKKSNLLKNSRPSNIVPILRPSKGTTLKHIHPNTRFPRQVENISYKSNKADSADRYIKVMLDLQPENEEDIYDYYDNQKYYDDDQEKHIIINDRLMNDKNLNKEIEKNSRLITRTLSESQERKRCTKNNMESLGSRKLQQFQTLPSENIEDGKKSTLKCRDCHLLKSNVDSAEPIINYNNDSRLKNKNDDYFINILNQLIDKLNKSKNLRSTHNKDLLARKSNEPNLLGNMSAGGKTTNNSSEEELILKLVKIKENRIMDKLNSSPETTFVNGKWVRNKILENKIYDFKPVVNDQRSELNYTDEPISANDLNPFNLTNPENQLLDTNDGDILNAFSNFATLPPLDTEENNGVSTSPLPEKNEHLLVSKETVKPIYFTSTTEDTLNPTLIDENNTLKFTTNDYVDQFNNENNKTNDDKLNEPTLNHFYTTPIYESNKDLSFDLNSTLKTKKPEEILESNLNENVNTPRTNFSEEATTVRDPNLAEKEYDSLENDDGKCHCNEKVIKNTLSSTMIQNITEIKTDSYVPPKKLKMKSHKRSDKLQKSNNNSKNNTVEEVLKKIKNDLNSYLLNNKQITSEKPIEHEFENPKVNMLQKSLLVFDENQSPGAKNDKTNNTMKTFTNKSVEKYMSPELKTEQVQLNDQKKRNNGDKNNNDVAIKKNKISLIPKYAQKKNPRQFVTPSSQFIPKNAGHIIEKYNNIDNNNMNKRVSILPKSLSKIPNTIISQIPPRRLLGKSRENIKQESSSKKLPEKAITRSKHVVPINLSTQKNSKNNVRHIDDVTVIKKMSNTPKSLLQIPSKINNRSSPTMVSRSLEKTSDSNDNVTGSKSRKSTSEKHKYGQFNQNPHIGSTLRKYKDNDSQKNSKIINSLDLAKLRKPSNLVKNNNRTKINVIPTYKYDNSVKVNSTDSPTDSEINSNKHIGTQNKASKMISSSDIRPKKKNEIPTTLRFKNALNDAKSKFSTTPPVLNKRIPMTNKKPFFKNLNSVNDQLPTEPNFVQKSDTSQDATFQHDANLNTAVIPKRSKISQADDFHNNEHGPYKLEDLEPIVFHQSTEKPRSSSKNSETVFRDLSDRPTARENIQGFKPMRPVSIDRSEYEDKSDSWKNGEGETNVKKHNYQPEMSTLNRDAINDDGLDRDGYDDVRNSEVKSTSQSRFEVLPRVKVDDAVFKIPLVGHKNFNNNGSTYISDIYVPIEKSNGEHSALSLTELLSGDIRFVNEHGEHHPLTAEHTLEANSPLGSTPDSKDRTDSVDEPCDPTILKAFKVSDEKQTAPIHIIQIINNGPCSGRHTGNSTVKKPQHNDEIDSNKFRNGGQRVSAVRSKDIANNRQINRKLEKAYNHFDSEILDRFLQVYAPPTV